MLRDPSLIPLSHQHQRALALCVRIDRGVREGDELRPWQAEIEQLFQQEIAIHFAAEEKVIFPAVARFENLKSLVEELLAEHDLLRAKFHNLGALDAAGVRELGDLLSSHIRKEERQLFEGMQQKLSLEELTNIGVALSRELGAAHDACLVPNAATRLRPATNQ